MKVKYINNSRWIEIISDLANEVIEARYGDLTYVNYGEEQRYSDEAQDDFNETYDRIESMFTVSLGLRSDIELLN
jgi:hypothetical protein